MASTENLKQFTRAEVEEHNSAKSCWFVIENKIYDVTKFLDEHPGGVEVLLEHGGIDATEDFADVGHSTDALQMRAGYLIGELVETETVEELFVDSSSGDDHKVDIQFDVVFPAMACPFITVDAMDVSGEHQSDVQHSIWKVRVDGNGNKIPDDQPQKQGGQMFQYFVKVVPTMYVFSGRKDPLVLTNQYSVTKHQKSISPNIGDGLPGLFVQYEFSPLMVKLTEKNKSFTHFLVSVCAIIGGIFTVASLIDSFIYHSSKVLQQKMELGKAT